MIKENVLRKNLLTGEIDYGNVDPEFEIENLDGNIIQDSPWIEISNDTEDAKNYFQAIDLKKAQVNRTALIKDAYSKAQFGLVKQNGSIFKVALSGDSWLDFERQVLKASVNGVADFVAINEAGILKVLKDIPFSVLQPLYKNLCDVSVGNFAIKNQLLYQVANVKDIKNEQGIIIKTAMDCLNEIVISFPEIQTFTIG